MDRSEEFWLSLDRLVDTCRVVIDRPMGSRHPRYPEMVYPLDYGYLEGTTSADGAGIDVWLGISGEHRLTAVIVTVDSLKRDSEIKLMLGCIETELQTALGFHQGNDMRALLVRRSGTEGDNEQHT
ncbi:MAG TPA: hypothetical protein VMC09_14540 [Anaerolineales bacterium]|nr:hypothetical protein [Anaerolineales bacterium]